jgi:hypothetical protein
MADSLFQRGLGARVKTSKPVTVKRADGSTDVEIVEYVEGYPPDTNAASLWLRNRRPDLWRDKQDVDMTVHGLIARMSDDERSAKALELLKRLAASMQPGLVIDAAAEGVTPSVGSLPTSEGPQPSDFGQLSCKPPAASSGQRITPLRNRPARWEPG